MNKLLYPLAFSLFLFSCSKSDSPTPPPPPPPPPVDTVASFMTNGWTKVQVTQSFLSDIAWIDADHLVTNASENRQIFGTANGGQSWQAFPFYAYGDNLIKIPDGSLTWTNAADKTLIGRFKNGVVDSFRLAASVMDLFYLDATHGFASLAAGSGLAETHNGGNSWQVASTGINLPASQYSTLFFLDSLHGITGFGLQVYVTTTGIHSWQTSLINDAPTGNYQCSRLEMISPNVAYAGFTNGTLFRSTDTGKTFSPLLIPTRNSNSGHWLDTQFFDANHGYACHDDVILQTFNGGASWDTAVFDKGKMFIELEFLDQNHGAVCTKEGAVYLYKN